MTDTEAPIRVVPCPCADCAPDPSGKVTFSADTHLLQFVRAEDGALTMNVSRRPAPLFKPIAERYFDV